VFVIACRDPSEVLYPSEHSLDGVSVAVKERRETVFPTAIFLRRDVRRRAQAFNAVIRFKKTDEDGVSSNYPTPQAKAFDRSEELTGLPAAPTRLIIGYLLNV
jgi:hypothetical protein